MNEYFETRRIVYGEGATFICGIIGLAMAFALLNYYVFRL